MKMALKPLDGLRQAAETDLVKVLENYKILLGKSVVESPLIIDERYSVVLEGNEVLEALRLIGAVKAPVIPVREEEVTVRPAAGFEALGLDEIIKAGLSGSRLPAGSFRVEVDREIPRVRVPLAELFPQESLNPRELKVFHDTLSLLYENWPTPLVRLKSYSSEERMVFAKLEGFNPFSNSIKDRVGWSMIMDALERGELREALYEATSTNTGIALASIANILGKRVKLFIPKSIQKASDVILRILGAEVVRMPASLTVEVVNEVDLKARSHGATHLNQFENDANLKVHLRYTAKELDQQLKAIKMKPDYIIGGIGTSGHMSAVSIYFKALYGADVKIIGVQPAKEEIIPGIRRVETGMKWIDMAEFDEILDVRRDEAIEGVIEVARREGLLIGLSAGAVFHAFKKLMENKGNYVLIFPDTGYKYIEQFEDYLRGI